MIFRNRYVQSIMLSHVLLQLGIWIRNFAILLYVTDLTNNDSTYVSLIYVAEFGPIFLFSIIGGTFADRWRPKRTMVWCDLLSAISVFAVLLTLVYGSWYSIFFATFISAILSQFSQPSAMKIFKQHVAEDKLQAVMAMFQTLMAIFMVIGPALGTFVYQRFGIEISIAVMGVMFLLSAVVLAFLPADPPVEPKTGTSDFKQELREGLRYVWSNRVLKTLASMFAVAGLAVGLIQPLMVYVTTEKLGMTKDFMQWLLMANGAAMLIGGGAVMGIAKKVSPQALLAAGMVASMVTTIGVGWSTSIPLTIALQAVAGLFFPCIHVGINTLMLTNAEQAYIGRVGGVLNPMFMGMMVVGMSLAGFLKPSITLFGVYVTASLLFGLGAIMLAPLFKKSELPASTGTQGSGAV
jgi:MFS transporter, DHA3 family, macrolide efflux protein